MQQVKITYKFGLQPNIAESLDSLTLPPQILMLQSVVLNFGRCGSDNISNIPHKKSAICEKELRSFILSNLFTLILRETIISIVLFLSFFIQKPFISIPYPVLSLFHSEIHRNFAHSWYKHSSRNSCSDYQTSV